MKPRKDKKPRSISEMRQKELAWMLYITEAYVANLRHAKAVNCISFSKSELRSINTLIDRANLNARELRDQLEAMRQQ
jgi:hypothetical protein